MEPRGGTELQFEFLRKYVSKELLDQFQICTSVPGKVPLDPNKINILWQKNSSGFFNVNGEYRKNNWGISSKFAVNENGVWVLPTKYVKYFK